MNRTQLILAALLVAQVALIALFRSPFTDAHAPSAAEEFLPEVDVSVATRLELSSQDGTVTVSKTGEAWTIAELDGFPADAVKVNDLLATLGGLRVREPVVTSARHHDNLEITDEENQGRVRLFGDDDVAIADLVLGSSPNYRVLHVRRAGEDPVYEVRGLAAHEVRADSSQWANKQLIDIDDSTIDEVSLENAHGSFRLARGETGWEVVSPSMIEGELDEAEVGRLIDAVAALRIADAVGPVSVDHGFDAPAAKLSLRWADGEIALLVGAPLPDQETQRYVTRDGFGFTGTIWESSVQSVLDRTIDELVGG